MDGKMIFTDYWKVLVLIFLEMVNTVSFSAKKLMERWYLLIIEKFLFWSFWEWEVRSFFSQRVDGYMIFTDYWKFLVLNFSVMENTVFFSVKKLMERWYLLVTEKFLFWTFRWWEIRSFFSAKKLMERLYLRGIFELSMIFQDLGNMVFCTVFFVLDVFLLAGGLTSFQFNVL